MGGEMVGQEERFVRMRAIVTKLLREGKPAMICRLNKPLICKTRQNRPVRFFNY